MGAESGSRGPGGPRAHPLPLVLGLCVAALALACVPPPEIPDGPGGTAVGAPDSRSLLGRDVDRPPAPECGVDRYENPAAATIPSELADKRTDYRYTSSRDPNRAGSVHHLCGQRGPGTDLAWALSKGRDDVLIAVLDSGIKWKDAPAMADLADQAYLNAGELPPPSGGRYDHNGDGRFSIEDYAEDPSVSDRNDNEVLDPEDLILDPAFSDGVDSDRNGYVDDISGWDFLWDDNDPLDDVEYGHGTGEARDSTAREGGGGDVGTCPRCRMLPVRVGDSFIADGGRFAAGVLFGLDSGADVVQEALGALNNPPQAQQAIDAAYRRGVPVVASMADEASKHPNLPAAMNHTIPVNSVTTTTDFLGELSSLNAGEEYLALNGCTNWGSITWVTVPSGSCSSEATGLAAGVVGLIEAAARDRGTAPYPGLGVANGNVLSANEVAQLLRGTADDVDFATPRGPEPANEMRNDPFERYPTGPGWDQPSGFGRLNSYEAVRAAAAGEIPPEADLTSPSVLEVLPISGSVPLVGSVAAVRSTSYRWKVQWTTGAQRAAFPATDDWRTVASGEERAPRSGTLGALDLATVAAALPEGGRGASAAGRGRPDEDRFAVRIRVVTTDAEGRVGVAQRQVFVHDDPDLVAGYPLRLAGAGAPSPAFVDLDGRTGDEMVVGTDDGSIHAYRADGTEAPGWPVRTPPATWWHPGSVTASADGIAGPDEAVGVGAPITADLDGDGSPEVAAADAGGHVSVWDASGSLRTRVAVDPRWSQPSATDERNRLKRGFVAQPAAGDLDGDGDLELVAAALDRHVYAWNLDGTTVAGFPVLVVDPAEVEEVDLGTHHVTFAGKAEQGGELIVTPAVGDLDGDGRAEIVVGAQEQYPEPVAVFPPIGLPGVSGNTRVFAIHGDGTAHRVAGDAWPASPSDQAFLAGWPVKLAMVLLGVLPMVGDGVNTQAAIGDVDGNGRPDIVVSSSAGPVYVLGADGRSPYDPWFAQQVALSWLGEPFGARATSHDGGVVAAAFAGPALGDLAGDPTPEVATATIGLGRALDQLLAGRQQGDTQLMAWDGRSGWPLPGFPNRTSDLAFFVTPAIADVDGDGANEVVAANGVSLLDAVDAGGDAAPGYPKLTGGWSVGTPAFGDLDGDGRAEVAITRRDGVVLVWHTAAGVASLTQWPRFGHDARNSGDARTPVR